MPSTWQRAWQVFNWTDDSLEKGGPHTIWVGCGGLWDLRTAAERSHMQVLRIEEMHLRAGGAQGTLRARTQHSSGWQQLPSERKGHPVSVFGDLRFSTGSSRSPQRTAPTATGCAGFGSRSGRRARRGRSSYNKDLLDKVMAMADGIEVEDLPQFTTRSELMKKHQS
ncbi:CDKN2AIP N-terminal-like protein isoform 1-T1 [Rhynchonycteris naso]